MNYHRRNFPDAGNVWELPLSVLTSWVRRKINRGYVWVVHEWRLFGRSRRRWCIGPLSSSIVIKGAKWCHSVLPCLGQCLSQYRPWPWGFLLCSSLISKTKLLGGCLLIYGYTALQKKTCQTHTVLRWLTLKKKKSTASIFAIFFHKHLSFLVPPDNL